MTGLAWPWPAPNSAASIIGPRPGFRSGNEVCRCVPASTTMARLPTARTSSSTTTTTRRCPRRASSRPRSDPRSLPRSSGPAPADPEGGWSPPLRVSFEPCRCFACRRRETKAGRVPAAAAGGRPGHLRLSQSHRSEWFRHLRPGPGRAGLSRPARGLPGLLVFRLDPSSLAGSCGASSIALSSLAGAAHRPDAHPDRAGAHGLYRLRPTASTWPRRASSRCSRMIILTGMVERLEIPGNRRRHGGVVPHVVQHPVHLRHDRTGSGHAFRGPQPVPLPRNPWPAHGVSAS